MTNALKHLRALMLLLNKISIRGPYSEVKPGECGLYINIGNPTMRMDYVDLITGALYYIDLILATQYLSIIPVNEAAMQNTFDTAKVIFLLTELINEVD